MLLTPAYAHRPRMPTAVGDHYSRAVSRSEQMPAAHARVGLHPSEPAPGATLCTRRDQGRGTAQEPVRPLVALGRPNQISTSREGGGPPPDVRTTGMRRSRIERDDVQDLLHSPHSAIAGVRTPIIRRVAPRATLVEIRQQPAHRVHRVRAPPRPPFAHARVPQHAAHAAASLGRHLADRSGVRLDLPGQARFRVTTTARPPPRPRRSSTRSSRTRARHERVARRQPEPRVLPAHPAREHRLDPADLTQVPQRARTRSPSPRTSRIGRAARDRFDQFDRLTVERPRNAATGRSPASPNSRPASIVGRVSATRTGKGDHRPDPAAARSCRPQASCTPAPPHAATRTRAPAA